MARKTILFIGGSLNMTRMTHAVARHLQDEFDCWFSPFYSDGLYDLLASHTRLIDFTVLGGNFRRQTDAYLRQHNLPIDYRGEARAYDLYVATTDLYVPKNLRDKPFILIQEGMTDPEGIMYHLVKWFKLPRYFASTSTNGLSNQYRYFCVASEGYRDFFIRKGVRPDKLVVTGIPNYDNCASYLNNDFPYRDFVLIATSDARETYKLDNRKRFLRRALAIANGRPVIFKLHPNENFQRAEREIREVWAEAARGSGGAGEQGGVKNYDLGIRNGEEVVSGGQPRTADDRRPPITDEPLIYTDGNIDHMIANCSALICQYSTVVYAGIALGKEVHSYFDLAMLKRLMPMQNGGTSGRNIAQLCRHILLGEPVRWEEFLVYATP
ncbi:hypothetical protein [Promineifilum sp.]|uniref:hypothetical protein n=1 Tax=Promineifilum sp. TaxID=2664178 RepID=UPI0035B23B44